jgi:uncharacterized membrane protein
LAWLLFKLSNLREVLRYLSAIANNQATTQYLIVASIFTFSAPVILYYAWHLSNQRWPGQLRRYEFLIFAALLVAIALNSGSPQKFIYFQF